MGCYDEEERALLSDIEYVKDMAEPLRWRKIIHECDESGAREEISLDDAEAENAPNAEFAIGKQ
jgi:pro-apoptotic serine protease NMA111